MIVLIGGGKMGQAFATVFDTKNIAYAIWDKTADKMPRPVLLSEIIPTADVIFFCVGSWDLPGAISEVKPYLRKETILISISKGIVPSGDFVHEYFAKEFSDQAFAFLGGPTLASEMIGGLPAHGIVASTHHEAQERISALFSGTTLYIETSENVAGVILGGVLKNIYALGIGIVQGLGWGFNQQGWFFAKAFREMELLATEFGTDTTSMRLVSGLGDFATTSFSATSRNVLAGRELGISGNTTIVSEALMSLPLFLKRINDLNSTPLLRAIAAVVVDHQDPKKALESI